MAAINMPPYADPANVMVGSPPETDINTPVNQFGFPITINTPNINPMQKLRADIDSIVSNSVGKVNILSAIDQRARGSAGSGGSEPSSGNQDPNPLIRFNPFLGKNVTSFEEGGSMAGKQFPFPYNQNFKTNPNIIRKDDGNVVAVYPLMQYREPNKEFLANLPKDRVSPFGNRLSSLGIPGRLGRSSVITDEMLANIAKRMGNKKVMEKGGKVKGKGIVNPYTGVPEYFLGGLFDAVTDAISSVLTGVGDVIAPTASSVFNAAGSVIDPVVSNVVSPAVSAAGGTLNTALNTVSSSVPNIISGVGDAVSDAGQAVGNIVTPIASPIFSTVQDAVDPLADAVGPVLDATVGTGLQLVDNTIQGGLDALTGLAEGAGDLFQTVTDPFGDLLQSLLSGRGSESFDTGVAARQVDIKRGPQSKENPIFANLQLSPAVKQTLSQLQKSQKTKLQEGDFVSPKDNPFITPNVEEELDYAAQGMKMPNYNMGGILSQRANEAIAINEMSALTANAMRKRANQMKKSGKVKRNFTKGGRF